MARLWVRWPSWVCDRGYPTQEGASGCPLSLGSPAAAETAVAVAVLVADTALLMPRTALGRTCVAVDVPTAETVGAVVVRVDAGNDVIPPNYFRDHCPA